MPRTFKDDEDGQAQTIVELLEERDLAQTAAFGLAAGLAAARARSLEREARRLAQKQGAGSAVAKQAQTRAADQGRLAIGFRATAERVAAAARVSKDEPPPGAEGVVLRGRVAGANELGIAGLTVIAIDDSGRLLGEAESGEGGAFTFVLHGVTAAPTPTATHLDVVTPAGGATAPPSARVPTAILLSARKGHEEVARKRLELAALRGKRVWVELKVG
jgi:hypothetical protein